MQMVCSEYLDVVGFTTHVRAHKLLTCVLLLGCEGIITHVTTIAQGVAHGQLLLQIANILLVLLQQQLQKKNQTALKLRPSTQCHSVFSDSAV